MMFPDLSEHTSAILDVDFSELEEAPCEWPDACDKSAEWAWVARCGCATLLCDFHKEDETCRVRLWLRIFKSFASTCPECGTRRWVDSMPRSERI